MYAKISREKGKNSENWIHITDNVKNVFRVETRNKKSIGFDAQLFKKGNVTINFCHFGTSNLSTWPNIALRPAVSELAALYRHLGFHERKIPRLSKLPNMTSM